MLAVAALTLAVPDLLLSAQRSCIARYMMPVALSFQLAVGYLIFSLISSRSRWVTRAGWSLLGALLILQAASCFNISQAEAWGWRMDGDCNVAGARIINACKKPVIAQGGSFHTMMGLCTRLRPDIPIQWARPRQVNIPTGYSDVFLWFPGRFTVKFLSYYGCKVVPLDRVNALWRVEAPIGTPQHVPCAWNKWDPPGWNADARQFYR
jgi:hypothetical protein